jgi:hypothetical protein
MKLLVHTCCAPCASGVCERFKEVSDETAYYFYNPYIHPFLEYNLRLESFKQYMQDQNYQHYVNDEYQIESLFDYQQKGISRCEHCYIVRLEQTAVFAKAQGFDSFSTTLLISPYQDQDTILALGNKIAKKTGINFYNEDLRGYFNLSKQKSRENKLYRQQYCGCVVSEKERYQQEKDKNGRIKAVRHIFDKLFSE